MTPPSNAERPPASASPADGQRFLTLTALTIRAAPHTAAAMVRLLRGGSVIYVTDYACAEDVLWGQTPDGWLTLYTPPSEWTVQDF